MFNIIQTDAHDLLSTTYPSHPLTLSMENEIQGEMTSEFMHYGVCCV